MKTLIAAFLLAAVFAEKDKLTGRWETQPSAAGNVTGVVFRDDNSFEGYVNRRSFVYGTYALTDSVFSLVDNGCDGREGVYKLHFFHNNDSVRFTPISDPCPERKQRIESTVLGRVKE